MARTPTVYVISTADAHEEGSSIHTAAATLPLAKDIANEIFPHNTGFVRDRDAAHMTWVASENADGERYVTIERVPVYGEN